MRIRSGHCAGALPARSPALLRLTSCFQKELLLLSSLWVSPAHFLNFA